MNKPPMIQFPWISGKTKLLLPGEGKTHRGWGFTAACRGQGAGSDRFLWQLRAGFWLGLHAALGGAVVDFILLHGDFFAVAGTPQRTQVFMATPLTTATAAHTEQVRMFL